MATVITKPMTADEFWEFMHRPENCDRNLELERGEVVELTRPGRLHGFVCANIAVILWNFAGARKKGYVCANDTGVIVERDPDTVRGPDVLFCEDATSPEQIDRKRGGEPPRLAVEVLSPTDSHGKVMQRVKEQLRHDTPLVWVVDPDAENVTVHRPGKEPYVVDATEEITGDEVLSDFRCKVADFFAMPGQ